MYLRNQVLNINAKQKQKMPKLPSGSAEPETIKRKITPNPAVENSEPGETTGRGWDAVSNKKALTEELRNTPRVSELWLKDGEEVNIQFLDDEPYAFHAHSVKQPAGSKVPFRLVACQLSKQRHCLLCTSGNKQTWRAAFRVLDYRGKYDSTSKKFLYDAPQEKMYLVTQTVALQIKKLADKNGGRLSHIVVTVSRTGSGKSDTSYSFQKARDEDENLIPPVAGAKPTLEAPEKVYAPLSDQALEQIVSVKAPSGGRDEDLE